MLAFVWFDVRTVKTDWAHLGCGSSPHAPSQSSEREEEMGEPPWTDSQAHYPRTPRQPTLGLWTCSLAARPTFSTWRKFFRIKSHKFVFILQSGWRNMLRKSTYQREITAEEQGPVPCVERRKDSIARKGRSDWRLLTWDSEGTFQSIFNLNFKILILQNFMFTLNKAK